MSCRHDRPVRTNNMNARQVYQALRPLVDEALLRVAWVASDTLTNVPLVAPSATPHQVRAGTFVPIDVRAGQVRLVAPVSPVDRAVFGVCDVYLMLGSGGTCTIAAPSIVDPSGINASPPDPYADQAVLNGAAPFDRGVIYFRYLVGIGWVLA